MAEAREEHVLEAFELGPERGVNARVAMPEEIHPPRTDGIQIAPAIKIVEPATLAAGNRYQGKLLVVLHLRARVPHSGKAAP